MAPGLRTETLKLIFGSSTVTGETRRLLIYCRVDLVVTLVAAAAVAGMRWWVISDDRLDPVVGIALTVAALICWAGSLAARNRTLAGLLVLMVANWAGLLAFTALVPFTLEFSPLYILIPALLAITYLTPAGIRATFIGALITTAVAAVLGRFQGGLGLEAETPAWNLHALELLALPTGAGLVGYVSWQNHRTLVSRARAVRESRARLVASTDRERRRIERDLHDGAQQHLIAAAVQLRVIHRLIDQPHHHTAPTGPTGPVTDLLTQAGDGLHRAIVELRDLAHGIYPAQLTDHGLEAALRTTALDCPLPITIHTRQLGRHPADIEANAYFTCTEAIQNATKHAGPDATIHINLDGRHGLTIDITDTGPGADPQTLHTGHGIINITDRIAAIGGTLTIDSHPGNTPPTGVHLHAHIPVPAGRDDPRTRRHRLPAWQRRSPGRPDAAPPLDAGLRVQRAATLIALSLAVVIYALRPNTWILVGICCGAATAVALTVAARKLRSGRTASALAVSAVILSADALLLTWIAPDGLPFAPLIALVPVLLAVPTIGSRIRSLIVLSVGVTLLAVIVGRFTPGAGLQQQLSRWIIQVYVLGFLLLCVITVLRISRLNYLSLAAGARAVRASRARLVASTDRERRRIERDLHDGAQQHLIAAAVQLRVIHRLIDRPHHHTGPVTDLLTQACDGLHRAIVELRDLAHGIYPAQLTDHGPEAEPSPSTNDEPGRD